MQLRIMGFLVKMTIDEPNLLGLNDTVSQNILDLCRNPISDCHTQRLAQVVKLLQ